MFGRFGNLIAIILGLALIGGGLVLARGGIAMKRRAR